MTALLDECSVRTTLGNPAGVDVHAVEHDSRRVVPGSLFFCLSGATTDGHRYAAQAVARGAVGVVCERPVELPPGSRAVVVQVPAGAARPAMAHAAAVLNRYPARRLLMVGVTGTNGKTTVTHLLGDVLTGAGLPTTVIGTLSGARTTPEAPELQNQLAEVRDQVDHDAHPRAVAMEVSSHALVQHRIDEIAFDVAVFTNLSHDHLDFHGSMEEYWQAKASLFRPGRARQGVVWAEDRWGRRLIETAEIPLRSVSRSTASDVSFGPDRATFTWRGFRVDLPLVGEVGVINALLAAEAAAAAGIDHEAIARGLSNASPVPGRMEVVAAPFLPGGAPFSVLVDYAHTPTSLEMALKDARQLTAPGSRLLLGFGCGGERDRAKRSEMGAVAARMADLSVVTSDNPRHEDPRSIVSEVLQGVPPDLPADRIRAVVDRRQAIESLLSQASPGDVVVIAGKGHEAYQDLGVEKVPFDDRGVIREILGLVPTNAPLPMKPAATKPTEEG